MNLQLDGFNNYEKPTLPGEVVNYSAYQDANKNRLVIYPSGDAMIDNLRANLKELGGNGTWNADDSQLQLNPKAKDAWRFGADFDTLEKTDKALALGTTAEKYLHIVDEAKADLFKRFPELNDLEQIAVSKRRRRRFSEDGDELDIDRYMACDPGCWSSMPRQDIKKKTASVYIDISCSAGTDSMTITKNFIYSLAMLDIINRAGVTTDVIVGATAQGPVDDAKLYSVACMAKEADEPMDVARLLSFCLPGVFRQYVFGTWCNVHQGKVHYGLGSPEHDLNKPFFDVFNADVKVKGADQFTDDKVKMFIGKIKTIFNMEAAV